MQCRCRLKDGGAAILTAFGVAVVGTLAGTFLAWMLFGSRLDADGYKVCCHALPCQQLVPSRGHGYQDCIMSPLTAIWHSGLTW